MKKKFKMPKPKFPKTTPTKPGPKKDTPNKHPADAPKLKPGFHRAAVTNVKKVKGALVTTMTLPNGAKLKKVSSLLKKPSAQLKAHRVIEAALAKPKRKYTKRSEFWKDAAHGQVVTTTTTQAQYDAQYRKREAFERSAQLKAKYKSTQATSRTIELVEKSTGTVVHSVPVELEYLATMQTGIARSLDHRRFLMKVRTLRRV